MTNPTLRERFDRYTPDAPDDECWEWQGGRHGSGYGYVSYQYKVLYAHRVSYLLNNGPLIDGRFVCHRCDNPPCVNPRHLFLGTPGDNSADMRSKGRHARGVTNGHSRLTEEAVDEIRRLALLASIPQTEIGARFGVSQSAVSRILNANRWVHITQTPRTPEIGA